MVSGFWNCHVTTANIRLALLICDSSYVIVLGVRVTQMQRNSKMCHNLTVIFKTTSLVLSLNTTDYTASKKPVPPTLARNTLFQTGVEGVA